MKFKNGSEIKFGKVKDPAKGISSPPLSKDEKISRLLKLLGNGKSKKEK